MSEDDRNYFDAENPNHKSLAEGVEDILPNSGEPLNTATLAQKLGDAEDIPFTSRTARRILYYAREYIESNHRVSTYREGRREESGGSPTWMWQYDD